MSYHLSQHARHNEQDPLLAGVATNAGRVTTTISKRTNTIEALESLWTQRHHHPRRRVRTLVCVVGAGLTLLVFTFLYEKNTKNKNETVCFGKTNDTAAYACPDTNGIPLSSITLPWGGIHVQFPQPVEQWETPSTNFVNFVANAQGVYGPVLAVLHTNGTYNANTTKRPSGTFYMCGPLQGLNGNACTAKTCGPHSHADYSNTGWDQGHMVSNHEGGLFAGGEQNTFSMCNIWPQGKQFNEQWWQHLEYTTDGYALTTESLILTGPIFANGTNTCMGIFNPEPASGNSTARPSSKTTGPTVPCETTPHSPIPIPSHFFKLLVDVEEKIYWTFLATNNAGPVPQLVPEMLSTWDAIRKMPGVLALPMNLRQAGYIEQHCVVNYTKPDTAFVSGVCSNTTPELIVRHSPPY